MNCPRCHASLAGDDKHCPSCRFSLELLDERYGSDCVYMDRLMDAVHCLTESCHHSLLQRMDEFEAMFPQLFFATYIDSLPDGTSLREFGFWLLNRAAVGSIDFSRPNENGILLLIDLNSRSASLSVGYALEETLPQSVLHQTIENAVEPWSKGDFHGGILDCMDELMESLKKVARRQGGSRPGASELPAGLRQIREGHHLPESERESQAATEPWEEKCE